MLNAIFLLFISAACLVFSVQNVAQVAVRFLAWQWQTSLSTLAAVAVLVGAILAQLLRRSIRQRQERAKKKIDFLSRRLY